MVAGSNTWAGAPSIPYGSDSNPTPSVGLTVELGEPFPPGLEGLLDRSAWWRLEAPTSETVGIDTFGTLYPEESEDPYPDTVVAVWQGDTFEALELIAWGDDNDSHRTRPGSDVLTDMDFEAVGGQTYWIQVSTYSHTGDCDYVLRVGRRIEFVTDWISNPAYDVLHDRDNLYHRLGSVDATAITAGEVVGAVNVDASGVLAEAYGELIDASPVGGDVAAPVDNNVSVAYGWETVPGEGTQRTSATIYHPFHLRCVSPWGLTGTNPSDTYPEDAIGWEWESAPGVLTEASSESTPVAAVLLADTILGSDPRDTSNDSPPDFLASDWITTLYATRETGAAFYSEDVDGSSWPYPNEDRVTGWVPDFAVDLELGTYDSNPGDTSRTLGDDIDLTPYLDDGRVALYHRTVAPMGPASVTPTSPTNDLVHTMAYGWVMNAQQVRWTMLPPRHRWRRRTIEVGSPFRRTFPRDDGLAGGTPRNYPTSKSVQAGNRTSAGYL